MEWVYNPPQEEPAVFEATAHAKPLSNAPFDLFSPAPAVEPADPHSEEDEPEFYGDTDMPDQKVDPEQAFKLFARHVDFAPAIYVDTPRTRVLKHAGRLAAAETRTERLKRLSAEVAALSDEIGTEDGKSSDSPALHDLTALREQLRLIESSAAKNALPPQGVPLLPPRLASENETGKEAAKAPISTASVRAGDTFLSTLERRVAALEESVGMAHYEPGRSGKDLGPLLEDVRLRLELISDASLPEKLKGDAREIAEILQRQVQNDRGAEALRTATILEKMERWETLAETVPLLVERLRGFRRLQDESSRFSETLSAVAKQVDMLVQRSGANSSLVADVQRNLEKNVKSVQENLEILQERLESTRSASS